MKRHEYEELGIPKEFLDVLDSASTSLKDIGFSMKFLMDLLNEDDWGFILKCHSLIDAALEKAILERCFQAPCEVNGVKKLSKIVSSFGFDGKAGKIAYIEAYGLLSKDKINFLRALNTLRNAYSHSIKNVDLSIEDISEQRPNERLLEKIYIYELEQKHVPKTDRARRFFISLMVISIFANLRLGSGEDAPL